MRYKGLDLNLLVACGAIMETGSVSRAAGRLHLSQPAMSSALSRLRAYFEDELFVVRGRRLVATPLAESLRPFVLECLRATDVLLSVGHGFEPATSTRIFRVAASDYASVALLSPAIPIVAREAPSVRIEIMTPTDDDLDTLEKGGLDLIVKPEGELSRDHPTSLLLEEQHIILGWAENRQIAKGIDEAAFFECDHISICFGRNRRPTFAERHLASISKQRKVAAVVQSFLSVPWLLIGTDRLAVVPQRLATMIAGHLPITTAPMPFPMSPMREMIQYHRATAEDEGLVWLIERLTGNV